MCACVGLEMFRLLISWLDFDESGFIIVSWPKGRLGCTRKEFFLRSFVTFFLLPFPFISFLAPVSLKPVPAFSKDFGGGDQEVRKCSEILLL